MAETAVSDLRRILPYPRGSGDYRGEYRRRRVAISVRREQSLQRFRSHQRRIARQHDRKFCVAQRSARDLHRVTGAVLRLLQHDGGVLRTGSLR